MARHDESGRNVWRGVKRWLSHGGLQFLLYIPHDRRSILGQGISSPCARSDTTTAHRPRRKACLLPFHTPPSAVQTEKRKGRVTPKTLLLPAPVASGLPRRVAVSAHQPLLEESDRMTAMHGRSRPPSDERDMSVTVSKRLQVQDTMRFTCTTQITIYPISTPIDHCSRPRFLEDTILFPNPARGIVPAPLLTFGDRNAGMTPSALYHLS